MESVFSIVQQNPPIEGCTMSRVLLSGKGNDVIVFSMAHHTDISAETYQQPKLLWVLDGSAEIYSPEMKNSLVQAGEAAWTPSGIPVGVRTETGAVYLEIAPGRTEEMNNSIQFGEVFKLANLVPYQKGAIINRDILQTPGMKFVVMAFDEGTGLSEHAAPGNAIVFALEGEATINYEGVDHVIHAGEEMIFAKNGRHAVTANGPFKMALLITLE